MHHVSLQDYVGGCVCVCVYISVHAYMGSAALCRVIHSQ